MLLLAVNKFIFKNPSCLVGLEVVALVKTPNQHCICPGSYFIYMLHLSEKFIAMNELIEALLLAEAHP